METFYDAQGLEDGQLRHHSRVHEADSAVGNIRTTMKIYTQAIPRAVREANRRVVRSIMRKKAALRRQ